MSSSSPTAIVIGAGPAGLCAAVELQRSGRSVTIVEQEAHAVGGLARTIDYREHRFDLGAHRFFSKNPEIRRWWAERLGDDFLEIERLTRILYRGKLFSYPLRITNVLRQLGPAESFRCALSYAYSRLFPVHPEVSFADWVRNRFGSRLFSIFFKSYTEKVWGIPCHEISADWAAQRIRGLSLSRAALASIGVRPKHAVLTTLTDRFHYPRLGSGMMWEATRKELERAGARFAMGARVNRVLRAGDRIVSIETVAADGASTTHVADHYISSMPLSDLALAIDPPLPDAARRAAEALRYRHLVVVLLIIECRDLFPDQWIYVHEPRVRAGRITNFGNWSPDMAPNEQTSGLALEYFCSEGDELWSRSDDELLALARRELDELRLAPQSAIVDGRIVRVPRAYPVFDAEYKSRITVIREALQPLSNLHVSGRNGMHKYNNQDHSMLTGIMAARAVNGEAVNPWKVNIDAVYLEEEEGHADSARLIPRQLDRRVGNG